MKAKRLFAMIFMFVFVFSTFSSPEVYAFGDETVSVIKQLQLSSTIKKTALSVYVIYARI